MYFLAFGVILFTLVGPDALGYDSDLFWDVNGDVYLTWSGINNAIDKFYGIWQNKIDLETGNSLTPAQLIFAGTLPDDASARPEGPHVYHINGSANTTSARDTRVDVITLERVVELDYAAHRLAIVPADGFVTAEWRLVYPSCIKIYRMYLITIRSNFGVAFRAHSRTGEFLRERHCPTVSLCVTSTDPILPNCKDVPFRYLHYRRLDYVAGHTLDFPNNLRAETIVTWNADSGDLRMVKIPHPSLEDITHDAQFQYISPNKIVLAGSLAFTACGAVLCAFSADAEDEEPLMFYQGEHTDPDGISDYLGQSGTSTLGPIVVHNHDSGRRITIFKSELLLGDLPSAATSRDPSGMREVWNYPNDTRTLNFQVPFLSVAATRVLVYRQDERAERPIIFVLDFDQTLLVALLSKQPS
ncbi:hypothetical protein H2248_002086 [Termitomyces sp. 'cryptogamus']|nr:hypothetical protein H2248_002086 [Termitomyces sp. 'cryptogamus']